MKTICKQVGGNHYQRFKYQPLTFILKLNLNFIQGSILKYIMRAPFKNGVEDLEKALSLCEIGLEYDKDNLNYVAWNEMEFQYFIEENEIKDINLYYAIFWICKKNYERVQQCITLMEENLK